MLVWSGRHAPPSRPRPIRTVRVGVDSTQFRTAHHQKVSTTPHALEVTSLKTAPTGRLTHLQRTGADQEPATAQTQLWGHPAVTSSRRPPPALRAGGTGSYALACPALPILQYALSRRQRVLLRGGVAFGGCPEPGRQYAAALQLRARKHPRFTG